MRVLIVRNNSNPKAVDASLLLTTYLGSQSVEAFLLDSSDLGAEQSRREVGALVEAGLDLAVVLGGDGTILHTARLLSYSQTPVLGINFGHLGFLANDSKDGVLDLTARALAGELVEERRANLRIDIVCEGCRDPYDDELSCYDAHLEEPRSFFALNEVALTRGAMGRIVEFSLDVSDNRIATMRGDGVVVASATGSTAYALSAGGPLVAPSFTGLIIVPLAPHTLRSRALLTDGNDVACVTLSDALADREATLFVDGDMVALDKPVRRMYVRRGDAPTVLLRASGESFYSYASEVFF